MLLMVNTAVHGGDCDDDDDDDDDDGDDDGEYRSPVKHVQQVF